MKWKSQAYHITLDTLWIEMFFIMCYCSQSLFLTWYFMPFFTTNSICQGMSYENQLTYYQIPFRNRKFFLLLKDKFIWHFRVNKIFIAFYPCLHEPMRPWAHSQIKTNSLSKQKACFAPKLSCRFRFKYTLINTALMNRLPRCGSCHVISPLMSKQNRVLNFLQVLWRCVIPILGHWTLHVKVDDPQLKQLTLNHTWKPDT